MLVGYNEWHLAFDMVGWATGWPEGHPACKKTGCWFVGGDSLTGSLHVLNTSSCQHHLLSSNKIQNGDILVPANPDLPGKWLLKWRKRESWFPVRHPTWSVISVAISMSSQHTGQFWAQRCANARPKLSIQKCIHPALFIGEVCLDSWLATCPLQCFGSQLYQLVHNAREWSCVGSALCACPRP